MPTPHSNETRTRGLIAGLLQSPLFRLVLLGLVLGFAFQGTRGLWNPDEGRYVDAALHMLDSGNYLAPAYSADRPNFSKPPMTYWLIAGSMEVAGRNAWAARAPYALAFLFTLLLLYAMGRLVVAEKPWLPALIYACAVFPFFTANIISTDVFLTLFEAVAMLGFIRLAFEAGDRAKRRGALLMWLGFGLAFLTKGPPGLIPLLGIIPFVVGRDGWRGLGRCVTLPGLVVFAVVGFTWYAVVMLRYPWLVHYFMHKEVYDRMFTATQRRHPGAFGWIVVYVPVLTLGVLPWWRELWQRARGIASAARWKTAWRSGSVECFLLLWLLLPLLVFCLVQSRLPLYVLPLFLPLSLLLALNLRDRIDLTQMRQRAWLGVWLVFLLTVKGGVAYFVHTDADNRPAARELAAIRPPSDYSAIVVVLNTALDYTVEQQTPWGLRFYLDKPVFGIAWNVPQSGDELCRALHGLPSALVIVDPAIKMDPVRAALGHCPVHDVEPLGAWRKHALALVHPGPAAPLSP